jgi:type 2 lantibiotic biosynthesis protein LanM
LRPSDCVPTRERLIDEALAIGRRLQQLACAHEGRVNWLGLVEGSAQQWHIMPAGPDLYNGLSGIAFFLAYLGQFSGEEQFTQLARAAWQDVHALAMREQRYLRWGLIGAFDGIGSLIYLLSHLGTLWHDPTLYQEAEEVAAHLPEVIGTDQIFDVVGGSAGCLAALLSLYAVAPSEPTLAAARACGDFLLSQARTMPEGIGWSKQPEQVPLTGMAHGTAGIALNLLRLAAVSKEERFHQAALAALTYERSMFLPEAHNWADLRGVSEIPADAPITPKRPAMVAWCHGAAGIGLARLESLRYLDDAATREEIAIAVSTTLAGGFGRSHSLCHGDMGNLETLLTATTLLPDLYPREKVEALQSSLLQSIQEQGWQSSAPQGTETPGLMHGMSGTGYMLLRQADPERVPSLLTLAPPRPLD